MTPNTIKKKKSSKEINLIKKYSYPDCAKLFEVNKTHWFFISKDKIRHDPIQFIRLILNNCLFNDVADLKAKINQGTKSNKNLYFYQLHANIFIVDGEDSFSDKNIENFIRTEPSNNSFVNLDDYLITQLSAFTNFVLQIDRKIGNSNNCHYLYLVYSHLDSLINSNLYKLNNFKTYRLIKQTRDLIKSHLYSFNLKRENKKFLIGLLCTSLFSLLALVVSIISLWK